MASIPNIKISIQTVQNIFKYLSEDAIKSLECKVDTLENRSTTKVQDDMIKEFTFMNFNEV